MKKYAKTLIILGCILIVAVAAVLIVSAINDKQAAEKAAVTDGVPIPHPEQGSLSELTYTFDGETYSFSLTDGKWVYSGDADYPVNESKLASMADALYNLTGVQKLSSGTADFEKFGLSEPTVTISAGGYEYLVGDMNPVTTDYYVYSKSDDTIYTINYALNYNFGVDLLSLGVRGDLPYVTEETLSSIVYTSRDGSETDVTNDQAARKFVLSAYFEETLDYAGDAAALSEYGLDDPMFTFTVGYKDSDGALAQYVLEIGNEYYQYQSVGESGLTTIQSVYAKLKDEGFVHTLKSDYLPTLSSD